MKPAFYTKFAALVVFLSLLLFSNSAAAQCGAGFTSDTINWDMQYFSWNYPPNPNGDNTVFAMGKNSMRLSWSGATNTFRGHLTTAGGVVNDHTGENNTFGRGMDIRFRLVTGADTMTFDQEVQNLRFTVHDIDLLHRMVVTATNAAGTSQNITIARPGGASGSNLTLAGSGTATATATGNSTAIANTSINASVNVTIPGPVKRVVLTFS